MEFYQSGNKVIAVSTFAGKPVRGIAKCDPADEFDLEKGKMIAGARCDQKIAMKRLKRAGKKYCEAVTAAADAAAWACRMRDYYMDASDALDYSTEVLASILERS